MVKSVSAFLCGLVGAAALVGAVSVADAHYRVGGCCGPLPPQHVYSDVNKISHVTNVHDVWRREYFERKHVFIHVTRIHPIVYVRNVTRIHIQPVAHIVNVHVSSYETLATAYHSESATVVIHEPCVCCTK